MLHITVETITGRSFKIRVSPHETIYFVKVKICQLEGIPISHQILIWKSIELNNDHTLSSYNIPNNSTLKLTLTMKGGPINSVLTDEPSFQDMVEYLTEPGDLPSSSSSSSSLVSEKKRGALILYRYGNHSLKIASREFARPEAYSVEKWRVKFEDLKLKNERQVENNKLKGKMAALRKQMQKVALNKEKKLEPPFDLISNRDTNEEESNKQIFDQSLKIISDQKISFDSHKEIQSKIEPSIISAESSDDRLIISPVKELFDPLYSPKNKDSKSMKPESWCSGVEVPWTDSRSIRALMDLRYQSSSSMSVSSSSETNLEETSIDDEDEDDEDNNTSVLNTPNSTSFEALNELEDGNNNNCLPEALETHPTSRNSQSLMVSSEISNECAFGSSQVNLCKSGGTNIREAMEVEKGQKYILPKVACDTTTNLNLRINDKLNDLSLQENNDALMRASPLKSGLSILQPRNPTFLDLLRSSRLREERKNLIFSKGCGEIAARACDSVIQMSSLDLCKKGSEEKNHGDTKQKVESLKKLEDDLKSRNRESVPDRISLLPKLPHESLSSKSFLAPQTSLSVIRKVPNSSSSCAMKSIGSEAKYLTCPYGLLPPIQIKNSAANSNQRCLPKLPSPRLSTRKESFSPFMKKRNACLSTLNNSCLKREQHVMLCASEDEEDSTENGKADIEDDFPTLEIPGSFLSSDLSGCKVRVKKFVEGRRGHHSPNLNLMKMLEVVTRENQKSRLIGRRTGYIISTSTDLDTDVFKEQLASSLDSEKVVETAIEPPMPLPKKKCAVCRKKTSLAASFICRCGQNFCSSHRYPESHICTIDYKMEGRKVLEERNPVVNAPKLPKI